MHKVEEILKHIERRREDVALGPLFSWLSNESIDGQRRLSFTPGMLYYLMGFKDVLGALRRRHPSSDMDRAINAYCGEDADHWRWYLTDLERLGFSLHTWGSDISSWCDNVWSESTEINRTAIFELVERARGSRDPIHSLALIWVFEATGVVFIGHTRKAAIALGMDDSLYYFGRVHFQEEFGHSVVAQNYATLEVSDRLHDEITEMVDKLFDIYVELFKCWYNQREKYHYNARPKERLA